MILLLLFYIDDALMIKHIVLRYFIAALLVSTNKIIAALNGLA